MQNTRWTYSPYRQDVPAALPRAAGAYPWQALAEHLDRASLYTSLYSIVVIGLIFAYHIALYIVVSVLASFLAYVWAWGNLRDSGPATIVLTGVVCVLLARLVWHIGWSTLGLIRDGHGSAGELAGTVLLSREEHADLYAFVSDVARRIEAPAPDEIRIAPRAVSHVSELRTLHDCRDRRLVLTLGLAHIAVFSENELRALLAHELAHFLCGDTRLRVFVCRFVESLRDSLEAWKRRPWHSVDPLFWFAFAFLHLFQAAAAPLHRQQELRADCVSAAAYGGALAKYTLLKDWALGVWFDEFLQANAEQACLSRQDVLRRFDGFIAGWRDLSPEASEYLAYRLAADESVTFWDSHPSVRRRLAAMRNYGQPEVFGHRPARKLLPGFRELVGDLVIHSRQEGSEIPDSPVVAAPFRNHG